MRFRASAVLCIAPLLLALAAHSSQKETPADEPRYDSSTNVDMMMVVNEVKEVSAAPLNGMHILARPESSRAGSESTDVYLGPDDYLKDFECHYTKGDRIQVKGSKVKFNGSQVVLAREVRMNSQTVYLRDDQGVPYWKK